MGQITEPPQPGNKHPKYLPINISTFTQHISAMFSNKNLQITYGLGAAIVLSAIAVFGYHAAPAGSSLETFFFALGGKMPEGIIQACTFACFFICLFEIAAVNRRIQREETAYMAKLLPETEQYVLYPEDVNRIKLEAIEAEKHNGPRGAAGRLPFASSRAEVKISARSGASCQVRFYKSC